jgi:hypothetical protein
VIRRAQQSQEFVDFLDEVVSNQPAGQEIHILDHFATHKNGFGEAFPSTAPEREIALHTHLLLVAPSGESWFSKLQRIVIDRGIFTSVADLKRKIVRYIRLYQQPSPFNGNTQMSENAFRRGSDVSGTAH